MEYYSDIEKMRSSNLLSEVSQKKKKRGQREISPIYGK